MRFGHFRKFRLQQQLIIFAVCVIWYRESSADSVTNQAPEPTQRHRIDLTAIFLDTVSTDTFNAIVGYTYNLSPNTNINVSVPYLDPDTYSAGNSGFGDTVFSFSYVPSVEVGANPWVPRTVGTGIAVLIPTGDASEGRSADAWLVSPYVGLVIPLSDRLFVAPQLGYIHSLDTTADGTDLRLAFADVGLGFVANNGFWSSYFPQLIRDFENDDWAINHRIAIGKMFSRNFGLSIDYSFIERSDFGSNLPGEDGFDEQLELNAHFTF